MLQGPDLSKWQGTIDFTKLKTKADFVIFRSSYGRQSKDAKFYEYAAAAKKAGIPILGVYHFCYATNVGEAEQEAENCMSAISKAGLDKNTIIFYDLEYDSVTTAAKKGVTIGKSLCINLTKAFCNKVRAAGYRVGVYFNKDYYRNMYDVTTLNNYIKWLAEYNNGKSPTYKCDLHQMSSTTPAPGISGSVDWNYLYNDSLLLGESKPTETPVEEQKGEEKMTNEEFYSRFIDAMEEYRIRLRLRQPAEWSKEAREFCIKNGIFRGDGEGNFQWNDFLTREQAAQLIYNAYNTGLIAGTIEETNE